MSSSGIIGSVEGGALRRRIHLEKARLLYAPSPGGSQSSPLQSTLLQRIVVSVELDHLTSNGCSQRF